MIEHMADPEREMDRLRAEVERLRAKTVNISVIHPPIDERVRELNERVTDLYADVTEWHDTAERNKRRAEKAEAEVARLREALENIDTETQSVASDVGLMRMGSIARAALRGGGERCLCDDDSPNHCAKCTRELLRGGEFLSWNEAQASGRELELEAKLADALVKADCGATTPEPCRLSPPCLTCYTVAKEAEVERLRDEVARLANLNISIGDSEAKARAEVARLEGLILVWRDAPAGEPGIAAYENLTNEAKRIRAQREEGKPLRAEDLLDGLPRLSTEAEAKAAMGSGQPLVKMREIGK